MKLIDFNTAFDFREVDGTPETDSILGGTGLKDWSAPETRVQPYYSAKCDVFSIGRLLAFMLKSANGCKFEEFYTLRDQNHSDDETHVDDCDISAIMRAWEEFICAEARVTESPATELLYDLVTKMTKQEPAERPTVHMCVAQFDTHNGASISESKCDSRDLSQSSSSQKVERLADELAQMQI
jgi:serine/threonine protein kinase